MAQCPKVNRDLPPLFARQSCLEEAGHGDKCRFEMTKAEIDALFEGETK